MPGLFCFGRKGRELTVIRTGRFPRLISFGLRKDDGLAKLPPNIPVVFDGGLPFGRPLDRVDGFFFEWRVERDADVGVFDVALFVDGEGYDDGRHVAIGDLVTIGEGEVFTEIFEPGGGVAAKGGLSVVGGSVFLHLTILIEILFVDEPAGVVEFEGAKVAIAMEELPSALFFMTCGPASCGGWIAILEPADLYAAAVGIVIRGVFGVAVLIPFLAPADRLAVSIGGGIGHHAVGVVGQPQALSFVMDVATGTFEYFVGIGKDEMAGSALTGAVFVQSFHLKRALDIIVDAVPAGVGVFELGVEAGVFYIRGFPQEIVKAGGLLGIRV